MDRELVSTTGEAFVNRKLLHAQTHRAPPDALMPNRDATDL